VAKLLYETEVVQDSIRNGQRTSKQASIVHRRSLCCQHGRSVARSGLFAAISRLENSSPVRTTTAPQILFDAPSWGHRRPPVGSHSLRVFRFCQQPSTHAAK